MLVPIGKYLELSSKANKGLNENKEKGSRYDLMSGMEAYEKIKERDEKKLFKLRHEEFKTMVRTNQILQKFETELKMITSESLVQFHKMILEISQMKMANLKYLTDSSSFGDAFKSAGENVSAMYVKQSEAIEKKRKSLLESEIDPVARENALKDLDRQQLEEVKKFADRLQSLVGEYKNIPKVYSKTMENEVKKNNLDLMFAGVAGSTKSMFDTITDMTMNSFENMTDVIDQFSKLFLGIS